MWRNNRRRIGRIRHEGHTKEEPEMKTDILIPTTSNSVYIMSIWPDRSREFKMRIGLGCDFHGLVEGTVDWNRQLDGMNL